MWRNQPFKQLHRLQTITQPASFIPDTMFSCGMSLVSLDVFQKPPVFICTHTLADIHMCTHTQNQIHKSDQQQQTFKNHLFSFAHTHTQTYTCAHTHTHTQNQIHKSDQQQQTFKKHRFSFAHTHTHLQTYTCAHTHKTKYIKAIDNNNIRSHTHTLKQGENKT